MTDHSHKDFDKDNRDIIINFIQSAEKHQDDLSGSVVATITQFIMNLRLHISRKGKDRGWVTPDEIIDSQIDVLRKCIIDLVAYKERLTKGVLTQ